MNWNWKEHNKEKSLFRSYYCSGCKQSKTCGLLTNWNSDWQGYCCACYFQSQQEESQEYSNYQLVYQQKVSKKKAKDRQLLLLKNYSGCSQCGSKEVEAYSLYENSQLVCQPCLMKKEGGASGSVSFLERSKWYKRYWKIALTEWLETYQKLPVNAECADNWLKNREHLKKCDCLEIEVKELVEMFSNSLKEYHQKLEKCSCKKSEKVRVDNDYSANCESCKKTIPIASKKRIIKNRNDPRFWGLAIKEKVLCGNCLESKKENMPPLRKAEFMRYRKAKRL